MYVSITRLKLKSIWLLFQFARQSKKAAQQAKEAPGNLKVKLSNSWFRYFYTITHWESKEDMQQFMIHGDHKIAMQQWNKFASEVKAHGFETDQAPTQNQVRMLITSNGRTTK